MKNTPIISMEMLVAYFKRYSYHNPYFTQRVDAFYNPRNREYLLLPIGLETFTKKEIIQFLEESKATDLPPEIEWQRLVLFTQLYKHLKPIL